MIVQSQKPPEVYCVGLRTTIVQARALMISKKVRHLPVVDEQRKLVGIISDRDIRTAMPLEAYQSPELAKEDVDLENVYVETIMTMPPQCISTKYTLQDTLARFKAMKVGAFPIVDENNVVVGIISDRDLLHGFIDLLGVDRPGCFLGAIIPPSPRAVSRIVSAFAEDDIAIASLLVLTDWQEDRHALFLYLLTQNIRHARDLVTGMDYELIDPMQWFFYQHTSGTND
jgi:acetoin utilization protein AcuB